MGLARHHVLISAVLTLPSLGLKHEAQKPERAIDKILAHRNKLRMASGAHNAKEVPVKKDYAEPPSPWRMQGVPEFENVQLFTLEEMPNVFKVVENSKIMREGNCSEFVEKTERERPMMEVAAEHPDKDGFCYWAGTEVTKEKHAKSGARAGSLTVCSKAREVNDYLVAAVQFGAMEVVDSIRENPRRGFRIDTPSLGGPWHTDYNYLSLESAYCLHNGWLNASNFKVEDVYNATRLKEYSDSECKALDGMIDQLAPTPEDAAEVRQKSFAFYKKMSWQDPSIRNAKAHANWKCMLGGLECDIANCLYNFCRFDNGFVGHAQQCRKNWFQQSDIDHYWGLVGHAKKDGEDIVATLMDAGT